MYCLLFATPVPADAEAVLHCPQLDTYIWSWPTQHHSKTLGPLEPRVFRYNWPGNLPPPPELYFPGGHITARRKCGECGHVLPIICRRRKTKTCPRLVTITTSAQRRQRSNGDNFSNVRFSSPPPSSDISLGMGKLLQRNYIIMWCNNTLFLR